MESRIRKNPNASTSSSTRIPKRGRPIPSTSTSTSTSGRVQEGGEEPDTSGTGGSSDSSSYYYDEIDDGVLATYKRILSKLEEEEDGNDETQIAALSDLSKMLLTEKEKTLRLLIRDAILVPPLVELLEREASPEVMLLAAKVLAYLCDALPASSLEAVRCGALPVLCALLRFTDYMDLAEQCLLALAKISEKDPRSCLHANTLMAVLSHFKIFPRGLQGAALSIVENICMKIPPDAAGSLMAAVPLLTDLLRHSDYQVLEKTSTCLNHIAEAFATSSETLDKLCACGMVTEAARLIPVDSLRGHAYLRSSTYTVLIRLLTTFARGSPLAAKTLHCSGISGTLKEILLVSDVLSEASIPTALTRSPEQIYEIVNLTNELLPPLPEGTILLPTCHATSPKGLVVNESPVRISGEPDETSGTNKCSLMCNELLHDQPELLQEYGNNLLPVIIQIYDASINYQVRYKLLSIFGKLMYFSTSDMVESLLSVTNIARFLATVLASKDPKALIPAIQIANILIQKLPGTFSKMFVKEGVVHAIDALRISGSSKVQASPRETDSDTDPTSGLNKHSRRHQGSTGCSNADFNLLDDSKGHVPGNIGSSPTSVESLHTEVCACAKNFKEKYFSSYPQSSDVDMKDGPLPYLKILCLELTCGMEESKDSLNGVVADILKKLSEASGASPFEFVESGIVTVFLKYFTCGRFGNGNISDVNLTKLRQQALRRYRSFIQNALPQDISESSKLPMTILVQKLQQALSSGEQFPIYYSSSYSSISTAFSDLTALLCPIKLRFCRAQGEEFIHDYSSNIVLTDPLASLADVENFLWPKVQMSESDQKPSLSARNAGFGAVNDDYSKLRFTLGRKQLSKKMTVYHALTSKHILNDDREKYYGSVQVVDNSQLWNEIFTITYEKANNQVSGASPVDSILNMPKSLNKSAKCFRGNTELQQETLLDSILSGEFLCDFEKFEPAYSILTLLHILEGLNQLAPRLRAQEVSDDFAAGKISSLAEDHKTNSRVPFEEFINSRLTRKLNWQLKDFFALCTGCLPPWCYQLVKACPFLFPFETRRQYLYSTAFGLSYATNIDRLRRQKVRISRNHILSSAGKVMELFGSQKADLEVEYFGEVGTGLGPTLEFYTLLSHELQTAKLGLWRTNFLTVNSTQYTGDEIDGHSASDAKKNGTYYSDGRSLVQAPPGLFPRPWPANSEVSQSFDAVNYFYLAGQVIAKALKDRHHLDLSFSPAFYKLILGQELDLHDIFSFDPEFGKNLKEMQVIVRRKQHVDAMASDSRKETADLHFHGVPIEDLHLDFTLPGYPDYILKQGEGNTVVNIHNLEEYISLVVDATVRTGVMQQIQGFKEGFNQIFDISSLQIFSPHELDSLLCGPKGLWEPGSLVEHIRFDHGYTAESPAIVNLLEILGNFTLRQQRAFCQFVTGAPRFPPGGLAALKPKLTIVKKLRAMVSVDDDLPSVMTCANYLRLPPYSTKEIMYKKLLYAINEGQGSFDFP